MKNRAKKSKAVCILGMHRSGTSVIARAVNLLGAYLGEEGDMMPPTGDNPRGYWERVDIMILNDRVLACLNRPWDTALPLDDGWQRSGAVEELREEMTSLVKDNFSGRGLWAWKDPRTSVLFGLWRDVVAGLGMELVCVFVVRNPLDVARSQLKRDGLPLDKSFGVWFNYNITALRAVRGLPCSFLSYDGFLADWEGVLGRCADGLAIPWPEDDRALKEEMAGFIRPGLRHSQSEIDELRQAGAPPQVVELAEVLEGLTDGTTPFDDALGARVEEMYRRFSSYSAFYRHDQEQLFSTDKMLAEKERLLAVKERRLEDILNSWSWRVTAPLRAAVKMVRKEHEGGGKVVGRSSGSPIKKVIVYQMGKVASTSLVRTLEKVSGVEPYHSHNLNIDQLNGTLRALSNPSLDGHVIKIEEQALIKNLGLMRMIENYKVKGGRGGKIYILTLSREPLSWFASYVTQSVFAFLPGIRLLAREMKGNKLGDRESIELGFEYVKKELSAIFHESYQEGVTLGSPHFLESLNTVIRNKYERDVPHLKSVLMHYLNLFCRPFYWFDMNIEKQFGVDVLEADYRERPYHFFEGDYFKLLMLKFEALDSAPGILSEWLGTKIDRLVRENVSRDKPYQQDVSKAIRSFRQDEWIMKMIASSRYAKVLGYG